MTPLLAATATDEHGLTGRGWVVLILAAILGTVIYFGACWFWPYTACGRCTGSGRRRSPSGRAWRKCRRCKGSGARVRTGRRVYNWLSRQGDVGDR